MPRDVAPLVVGLGRVGVTISTLAPNTPIVDAHAATIAAMAAIPSPGVAVALRAALQLGCRARLVGTHGADLLGQLAVTAMRDAGIDTERTSATGASPCDLVTVAAEGRTRMHYAGERGDPLTFDAESACRGASAILIDGTLPEEQLALAAYGRRAKLPVILHLSLGHAGELRHGTAELIAASNILIASESAATEIAPRGEVEDALGELIALGPRAVVITLGNEGAVGRHGAQTIRVPAFPSEVLDSFGVGSVFHGAFAAALLSEVPFARCIELAAAAAALSLRELGPWSAMPTREDILALVRTRRVA